MGQGQDANKKIARALALLVFVSCSVTAFSIAALSYTFITGDLPFGVIPQFRVPPEKKKKEARVIKNDGPGTAARFDEAFLKNFYDELQREREKISREKEKLARRKKAADEIKKQALEMQKQIERYENKVKSLLIMIDEKEVGNSTRLATIVSGLQPALAAKMLMEYDNSMAARILYFMNQKKAAEIIGQLVSDDKKTERVKIITKKMQLLAEKFEEVKNE
jgi:flagellar motility protein MotE (MotC chaperone)